MDGKKPKMPMYLRRKRKEAMMTQRELAKRLGVDEHTVYSWEHGLRAPCDRSLRDLCNALALDFADLLVIKMGDLK